MIKRLKEPHEYDLKWNQSLVFGYKGHTSSRKEVDKFMKILIEGTLFQCLETPVWTEILQYSDKLSKGGERMSAALLKNKWATDKKPHKKER